MMGQEETIRLLQECDAGSCYLDAGINMKSCRRRSDRNWKLTGMRGKNRI